MTDSASSSSAAHALRGRRVAAVVLLIVAGAALLGKYLPFNWWDSVLVVMGIGFIVWAALARVPGLLVPGGILTGIGVGQLLRHSFGNGVFLLSMAAGFLLISLLSRAIFGRQKGEWWPLFPAGGLAFAGLVQLAGPDFRQWLRALQPYWPYALIVVALYLLFTKPAEPGK